MRSSNSGLAHGTSGSPQTSIEQNEYGYTVMSIEEKAKEEHDNFLRNELPKTSPLKVPKNASIKEEHKNGYEQVKYTWTKQGYNYLSRWHTRTPNAPKNQGNTWVVERKMPGIGFGTNARRAKHEILVGKKNGKNVWVPKKTWDAAIRARKQGTSTKEQKEMLDNGHWKA